MSAATFVLVHGGGHGSSCWQPVSRRLRGAGHEVHAPTLSGLGERRHLLTAETGLDTGHDLMLIEPDRVAALLHEIAAL